MGYSDEAGIVINRSHRRNSSSRRPKSSRPKRRETRPSILASRDAKSRGVTEIRANRFSLSVSTPEVPATKSVSFNAASRSPTLRAASRISMPRIARRRASAPSRHGFTRTKSSAPKFLIDRATAPTFPSFFGSTRTTSAVGNVIAFDSSLRADAVIGVFNNHARGVWAWAYSDVPPTFHPRHALERWYRYHLYEELPIDSLRTVGSLFAGAHDFRSFTSEPPSGPFMINHLDVTSDGDAVFVDVRAESFRRGMVRRIVSAMVACARGDVTLGTIRAALEGTRHDFGLAAA